MDALSSFIAPDRRHALAGGAEMPDRATGGVLFADISGFTRLTEAFAAALGPQRGAEELTAVLNRVYDALIAVVDRYGGSVISFSGDAITAWFAADSGARAVTCALALQTAMGAFAAVPLPGGGTTELALKVGVTTGPVRRFCVGDPAIQQLDVLAGAVLDRLAAAEGLATRGEVLVDSATGAALAAHGLQIAAWRADQGERFIVVRALDQPAAPTPWAAPVAPTAAQVQSWLLPALWTRMAHGQELFLTELRPAVALFLRFTGIDYDAPEAGGQLDGYLRWVQGVLAHYDAALLDVTIGDKGSYLYAAFGAPVAHSDDSRRAAAAALELRLPPANCPAIRTVQIGLSSGQVRAGAYGGTTRRTYGVLGDAVNVAARLMQAAPPGGILATAAVRQGAGDHFTWTHLPPLALKGKSEPVAVYALEENRIAGGMGLLEPAYRGPVVGRVEELAALDLALAAAQVGHGQVVGLAGEAGLGKSRLVAETVQRAQRLGFAVCGGAAQSYGIHTPYLAWHSVWRTFFAVEPDRPLAGELAALRQWLTMLDPTFGERLPLLGPVLGLTIPDTALTAAMDGKLRQASLAALLLDCLRAHAQVAPLLIVLEDCHWLDPLARELLTTLGRGVAGLPVLLLLAYRPPDGATLPVMDLAYATELRLSAFTPVEATGLIAAHFSESGAPVLPPEWVDELTRRAEGNPFYLEELLNYLDEQGVDPTDVAALTRLDWPASLQSLLLARIDQLTESQRTVLKVASIIGRLFLARQLWGVYPDLGIAPRVAADLAALDRAGLTPQERPEPELAYLFKHIVTQEVTYASLPHALRARLHEQFAAWVERESAPQSDPPLDLLAYHYGRSANADKQREYYQRAGDAARAGYANAVAATYYERLLDLLPPPEQGPVLLAWGRALEATGDWKAAALRYNVAITCGDALTATWAKQGLGMVYRYQGALDEASRCWEETLTEFALLEDEAGVARTLTDLGILQQMRGTWLGGQALLQQSATLYRQRGDRTGLAYGLCALATGAWNLGNTTESEALYRESLALAQESGDQPGAAMAISGLAVVAQIQQDYARAEQLGEETVALFRRLGDRRRIAFGLGNLGNSAAEQGRLSVASERLRESLTLLLELSDKRGGTSFLTGLVGILVQTGHTERSAQVLGAITRALGELGGVLESVEQQIYDQSAAQAERELGTAAYAAAYAAGQNLTWEQATTLALAASPPPPTDD